MSPYTRKRFECRLRTALELGIKVIYISEKSFVAMPTEVAELEILKKQHCPTTCGGHGLSTPAQYGNVAVLDFFEGEIGDAAIGWVGGADDFSIETIG